jgi:hypothetical protein
MYVGPHVLTLVTMNGTVFWDVTSCSPEKFADTSSRFRWIPSGLHVAISQDIVIFINYIL